jgi:hypothetical protein
MQYEHTDVFDGRMELDEKQDDTSSGKGKGKSNEQDNMMKQHKLTEDILQYGRTLAAEFHDTISEDEQNTLLEISALFGYQDARDSSIAHLLDERGRESIADQLNSAILGELKKCHKGPSRRIRQYWHLIVAVGKASASAAEKIVQMADVLITDLSKNGSSAALLNVRGDFMGNGDLN